ncbi:MAG: hypothetical protein ACOC32_03330 [Nanoarchaeota archaeon]
MTKISVIIIVLLGIISSLLLAACDNPIPKNRIFREEQDEGFSAADAEKMARSFVKNSYQFVAYQGSKLHLDEKRSTIDGYEFVFTFDVDSDKLPEHVSSITMTIPVVDAEITNISMLENTE